MFCLLLLDFFSSFFLTMIISVICFITPCPLKQLNQRNLNGGELLCRVGGFSVCGFLGGKMLLQPEDLYQVF